MINLTATLQLTERRCESCNRWFACESSVLWRCGACSIDRIGALHAEIAKLNKTISALRGALKRKKR